MAFHKMLQKYVKVPFRFQKESIRNKSADLSFLCLLMCLMCCSSLETCNYFFFTLFYRKFSLEQIFDKNWVRPKAFNYFCLSQFRGSGFCKEAKLLWQCLFWWLSSVYSYKGMLEFSKAFCDLNTTFGTGLLSWLVCGVLLKDCLECFLCYTWRLTSLVK